MIDKEFREEFKEKFIEISKDIKDPKEEKEDNEFDLGIDFSEKDVLSFEEEQEVEFDIEDGQKGPIAVNVEVV